MIPTYSISSTYHEDHDHHVQYHSIVTQDHHLQAASSSSISCNPFLNYYPNLDQASYNYPSEFHHSQVEGENCTSYEGSYDPTNKLGKALKLSVKKKEEKLEHQTEKNPVKWMSSKMRFMQKMKNSDRTKMETKSRSRLKLDDQKQPGSLPETDHSSNSSSINSNTPIRVCSDCNTTKTPLWRSGPKGPKSLCNACGIRQRKARRALAAAAAAASGSGDTAEKHATKIKVQQKERTTIDPHQTAPFKKRFKFSAVGTQNEPKKPRFEDFLVNLSNDLALSRVFPQDEKEAAILLMALSCGLVHG